MPRSLGITTVSVLASLERGARYGLDITQRTELHPGTVYTTLRRLEERGLVRGRWEDAEVAERERRPRRRYYELTCEGAGSLAEARARLAGSGVAGRVAGADSGPGRVAR